MCCLETHLHGDFRIPWEEEKERERERKVDRRDREREKVSKTVTPKILSQLIWGDTWKLYLKKKANKTQISSCPQVL